MPEQSSTPGAGSEVAGNSLSIAVVACNEAANIGRTLESVKWADEIVVVDSGSTDDTIKIAESYGARVISEPWKGYGGQMNSALDHCRSEWLFSLDADEVMTPELAGEIRTLLAGEPKFDAYWTPRLNLIFGRWIRHGGFYPDRKLRLFRKGVARLEENTEPHTTPKTTVPTGKLKHDLLHYQYPTVALYIEHMDRYSSQSVPLVLRKGRTSRSLAAFVFNIVVNPTAMFLKNYIFRLGFLDGREGLLVNLYHSAYVSWKYAKAWERSRG
ncbi:MAG TPA: glycosyltransferase family 2 protein [Candidatus Saccharimonadales bacterium]|nr:glycosyltransferase family 2 protein [Candidatus Saccharimonadales bacterium]